MRVKILSLLLIFFYFTSCATLFKGTTEEINFKTSQDPAEIWINGQNLGQTPLSLKLESKKTYTIEFKKEGYKTVTKTITNHVGAGWIILDVLAGLIPVVVDAATGAWYSLDQKNVNAILEKHQ
jgi:hypothetical protein